MINIPLGEVPDIRNGYMINGYGGPNQTLIGIESALSLDDVEKGPRYAFLGKECRAERVLAADSSVIPRIFDRTYEFVALHSWEGTHLFRSGSQVLKRGDFTTKSMVPSVVRVDYITPNYLSFEEAFQRIELETASDKELFMHISWEGGLNLYCRCKHTNYPNADTNSDGKYLQPIVGQVPYYEDGRFQIAYVACSMQEGQRDWIEFCVREKVNVMDVARVSRKLNLIRPLMRFLCPIWVDEYSRRVPVTGRCRFYVYS